MVRSQLLSAVKFIDGAAIARQRIRDPGIDQLLGYIFL
jgi:hypothetical protein